MINWFRIYNVLFVFNKEKTKVLLLKKSNLKRINGLLTGLGGKIERSEFDDLKSAVLREMEEESSIKKEDISELYTPLVTMQRILDDDTKSATMYWYTTTYTGDENKLKLDCDEGELKWYDVSDIKDMAQKRFTTDAAGFALPYILDNNLKESNLAELALMNHKNDCLEFLDNKKYNLFGDNK